MNQWSLVSEYFALILLAVVALFFYRAQAVRGRRKWHRLYRGCLALSALSILLNIVCVGIIENIHEHSVALASALNTLYFFVSWLMITVMAYYLFRRVLEFVYDKRCLRRVRFLLGGILACFTALLAYNLFSGVIFYFDETGLYRRGPLNAVGFAMPLLEVALLLGCCLRHRGSVGGATKSVLFVAAPICVLLLLYQAVYPEQLLNGALCALVDLIIFIGYREDNAERDRLTGLDGQRSLMNELTRRTEDRQSYQVILVKLRSLSSINRIYGQRGGDIVLFQVGEALRRLAGNGRVFRGGGEVFALLFDGTEETLRKERLLRVRERMRDRWRLGEYEVRLSFLAVELCYSGQAWTMEDVGSYINDAVRIAAAEERELLPFDEKLVYRRQRREYLLRTMHAALREGRFQVWYQPVYYRDSGKFESAEALLRLFDEQGELISPNEFIPVAEETSLIDSLHEFVLEAACRLLGGGRIAEMNTVSVNLPIRQLTKDGLRERMLRILQTYGVTPQQIRLEVTERDVAESGNAVTQAMKELEDAGFRFMLDDFGTGYSNFARVLAMPFETIKLDRSLMLLLEESDRSLEIMKSYVVPLFHRLGQTVVAEGVETERAAALALACGIERIQGFYYAKPMPESALPAWYESRAEGAERPRP